VCRVYSHTPMAEGGGGGGGLIDGHFGVSGGPDIGRFTRARSDTAPAFRPASETSSVSAFSPGTRSGIDGNVMAARSDCPACSNSFGCRAGRGCSRIVSALLGKIRAGVRRQQASGLDPAVLPPL